jgi:hypothetical protein
VKDHILMVTATIGYDDNIQHQPKKRHVLLRAFVIGEREKKRIKEKSFFYIHYNLISFLFASMEFL